MKKIGVKSLKDALYFTLIGTIFFFIAFLFYGAIYEMVTGSPLFRPIVIPGLVIDLQFPNLLRLSVFLMYGGSLGIFIMGMAGLFYKEKKDYYGKETTEDRMVSVIVPAHNEENVIENLISDLLRQSYSNFEILVVCHNTTDGTAQIVEKIEDERVRAVKYNSRSSGKALALNRGFEESSGEIIVHFDADNRIKDIDFLSKAVAYFNDPKVDGLQTGLNVSNPNGSFLAVLQKIEFELFSMIALAGRERLGLSCILAGTGIGMRRSTIKEMGGWNNSLVEDFELSTRLSFAGKKIVFADNLEIYDEKPTDWSALLKQRSRWFKGHLQVGWDNLHNLGNPFDYLYRMLSFSVMAWWASLFLYIFYIMTGQSSVWDIGNEVWILWTIGFQIMPILLLWKIGGIKKILFFLPQLFFSFHWLVTGIVALKVTSWAQTKTVHGAGLSKKEGDEDD